jgi:hypothetical protein
MSYEDDIDDDPNDPNHPDFDLSEAATSRTGWSYDERPLKPWFVRRWVMLLVAAIIIAALVIPILPR